MPGSQPSTAAAAQAAATLVTCTSPTTGVRTTCRLPSWTSSTSVPVASLLPRSTCTSQSASRPTRVVGTRAWSARRRPHGSSVTTTAARVRSGVNSSALLAQ